MALLLNEAIGEFEQESFSIVLNTNRESVGVGILPRCSCIWERKHRLVHRYNNLESFLYNILLIVLPRLIKSPYKTKVPDTVKNLVDIVFYTFKAYFNR